MVRGRTDVLYSILSSKIFTKGTPASRDEQGQTKNKAKQHNTPMYMYICIIFRKINKNLLTPDFLTIQPLYSAIGVEAWCTCF